MSGPRSLEFAFAARPLNSGDDRLTCLLVISLYGRKRFTTRDVSAVDIMYYCRDGRVVGVLND